LIILIGVPEGTVVYWVYAQAAYVVPVVIRGLLGSSAFDDACFLFQGSRWVRRNTATLSY
jgi:hypothetical protein